MQNVRKDKRAVLSLVAYFKWRLSKLLLAAALQ